MVSQPSEYPGVCKTCLPLIGGASPTRRKTECAFLTSSGVMPCCCPHDDTLIPFLLQRTTSLEMLVHALGMPSPVLPTLYHRSQGVRGSPPLPLLWLLPPYSQRWVTGRMGKPSKEREVEDTPRIWWLFHTTRGEYGAQTPATFSFFLYRSSCCPRGPQKERQTSAKTGFRVPESPCQMTKLMLS